ncbi:MAG: hypothetical protein QOG35_2404 [Solirubrobacteraceae bacterium]|jgi:hypothetical protein|nr:hypothetical protein [Solirubrobacteraceae bacterium]
MRCGWAVYLGNIVAIDTSIADLPRVLVVANRTAATPALVEAVRERARRGAADFRLVVPATPRGLHRVADPEDHGLVEAEANLYAALPVLSAAAGVPMTGHVGDANPLSAIEDAVHLHRVDEIIISTLRRSLSSWLKLDLPNKARALGLPVTHIEPDAVEACVWTRPALEEGVGSPTLAS